MSVFRDFDNIAVHYAHCHGAKIFNQEGQLLGKLTDFFVDYEEIYPSVLAIQYGKGSALFYVRWDDILHFSPRKIVAKNDSFIGNGRIYPKAPSAAEYPPLGKVVLDRQIVDTHGKKVVRVNDIQFMRAKNDLRVTHTCIGLRSMIRRLGVEAPVDSLIRFVYPRSSYLKSDVLIDWKFVHSIPNKNTHSSVQIDLSNKDIKGIHPADLADILEDLDSRGGGLIFKGLDAKTAARTLSEISEEARAHFVQDTSAQELAKIVSEMAQDDAADILGQLEKSQKEQVIGHITDGEQQKGIKTLLTYDEDSAGGLMTTKVFQISPNTKKSKVLDIIRKKYLQWDTIYDIYIIDSKRKLLGICPLHKLLIPEDDLPIGEIMEKNDIKSLPPAAHWKEVARHMKKYNLVTLPILDQSDNLLGIISVDDILDCLIDD